MEVLRKLGHVNPNEDRLQNLSKGDVTKIPEGDPNSPGNCQSLSDSTSKKRGKEKTCRQGEKSISKDDSENREDVSILFVIASQHSEIISLLLRVQDNILKS